MDIDIPHPAFVIVVSFAKSSSLDPRSHFIGRKFSTQIAVPSSSPTVARGAVLHLCRQHALASKYQEYSSVQA